MLTPPTPGTRTVLEVHLPRSVAELARQVAALAVVLLSLPLALCAVALVLLVTR